MNKFCTFLLFACVAHTYAGDYSSGRSGYQAYQGSGSGSGPALELANYQGPIVASGYYSHGANVKYSGDNAYLPIRTHGAIHGSKTVQASWDSGHPVANSYAQVQKPKSPTGQYQQYAVPKLKIVEIVVSPDTGKYNSGPAATAYTTGGVSYETVKAYDSGASSYGSDSSSYGSGAQSYGSGASYQAPAASAYGSNGASYGNDDSYNSGASSHGSGAQSYDSGASYQAPTGPTYGSGPSSYGHSAPAQVASGPAYAPKGPSYGHSGPAYGHSGPAYGHSGPAYAPKGPSYGPSHEPAHNYQGASGPSYGSGAPAQGPSVVYT